MAVAVIGGAGFIGSNLVDDLMVAGMEVDVLDNFSEGKWENLARWKGNDKLQVIRGDVRDATLVDQVCDHKSWVFHLAAMSRVQPSMEDPRLAFEQNVMGTVNVLEACRKREVKRLVFSSTSAIYENWEIDETQPAGSNEWSKKNPLSPYAMSKFLAEAIVQQYRDLYGVRAVTLRYANVYGPRMPREGSYATAIGIFRKQMRDGGPLTITGDGKQRRDYVFVGDVVRANIMAAMNHEVNDTLNVGTGANYSINEVADLVAPGFEKKYIPARQGEPFETLLDISKIKKDLGWKPMISLPDGLHIMDMYEKVNDGSSLIIATR